jgi:hypothetical protein
VAEYIPVPPYFVPNFFSSLFLEETSGYHHREHRIISRGNDSWSEGHRSEMQDVVTSGYAHLRDQASPLFVIPSGGYCRDWVEDDISSWDDDFKVAAEAAYRVTRMFDLNCEVTLQVKYGIMQETPAEFTENKLHCCH